MALGQDQKDFIEKKVKELGSAEAVKQFYNKDCPVDNWAITYAHKTFDMVRTK